MSLVTIVTACHNGAATIGAALESSLNQTLDDWEHIVVDDASSDDTVDVVTPFLADTRIRLMRLDVNRGSGHCRNVAIRSAQSELIAVLDDDDIALPSRLEAQVNFMASNTRFAGVGTQLLEFGVWGGPVKSSWPTTASQIGQRQAQLKIPIPHPSTMFRRSDVLRVGGYDEACRRAQDYALFLRLGDQVFGCLDEPHVLYRTDRPISLGYAIRNGRYAKLARSRNGVGGLLRDRAAPDSVPGFPRSVATDAISSMQWVKRYLNEARQR